MFRNISREWRYLFSFRDKFSETFKGIMISSSSSCVPTAGVIVIGDEILKGQVRDTNSNFIISKLYKLGVRVKRVSVIGDDAEDISKEVRKFSHEYTYVITSGGIGPTHDDVTFEGVAKAFGENVVPHPELVEICHAFFKTKDMSSPVMKLACIPKSAKLTYWFDAANNQKSKYPNISVKNVYIFPGVPPLLEKSFSMICEEMFGSASNVFYNSELYISGSEVLIAEPLSLVVKEFPNLNFGSYPLVSNSYYSVKITVEADSKEQVTAAKRRLLEVLPKGCLVDYDSTPLDRSYAKIEALSSGKDNGHIRKALEDVVDCLTIHGHSSAVCVDAGLQAVATLHLVHAAREKLMLDNAVIPAVLLKDSSHSLNAENFQGDCASRYALNVQAGPCDIGEAVTELRNSCPTLRSLIAGTECSVDELQQHLDLHFGCETVLLEHPTANWSKIQVQQFVRGLSLPYCE